jgi:phenylalanyl-tRNA synthetase beta chain
MKASLRWISEFVDLPTTDPVEVAQVLTVLGLEVEGVETVAAPFSGVVVADVLEVEPHPDADKIRVVTIDPGNRTTLRVVCGAWNFDAGATVAYATVGSVLAGGLEVGEKEIRGVMSPGMIASEAELGIGDDAAGILVLDGLEPGTDFAGTLPYPDTVFDLSITPNRPDAMSIYGVARDLAAYWDLPLRTPDVTVDAGGAPTTATVVIEDPDRCPRFTAREVRGVTVRRSPLWMRLRLRDAGVRPINNVVDVTNYVMLEYGQPLHAFDLDLIPQERIVVRTARPGEKITTLDDVGRTLTENDLVIADPDKAIGIAGVMGGATTEVSESTDRVLIEVAHFEPGGVLLTGKRLGLRTEAVHRFERGVDPELPPLASARAAGLMADLAGGEIAGGFVDEYPGPHEPVQVHLADGEAQRILGIEIARDTAADYLRRLGFEVSEGDGGLDVVVPSYRPDGERPADLIEEIARIHGYDRLPATLPRGTEGTLPEWLRRERRLREVMVGGGYHEVWNFDFMGVDEAERLGLPEGDPRLDPVRVRNPLNEEQESLRTTLLPGLLRGVAHNQARNQDAIALFEIGAVFLSSDGELPEQPRRLAFVAAGPVPGPSWQARPDRDALDAAGVARLLIESLRLDGYLEQSAEPGFHPGRCAVVVVDDTEIGVVGEIHPSVAERFEIDGRVVAGEIDIENLMGRTRRFVPPSTLPPVVFDLAFDLPERTPAAALLAEIRASAGVDLESMEVFDVFSGPPLEAGRRSIAVRLTMRSHQRTLTDEEMGPVRALIADRVEQALDGRLRGAS